VTAVKDVRGLVPRTPPEGLKHWVLNTRAAALERSGLIYEAEYVKDWGFGCLLDEWAKPRKTKMVRVTCSCCGDSMLLHWAPDHKRGYGFILPEDVEGGWDAAVMAAGDECRCPMCNTKVLVNKRAAVRDYYVTAETTCMSAALVGEERLLALTGWTVQARTHKSGCFRLEIIPAEAYVFSSDTCVQLLGWRRGYSGTAGYFVQYRRAWSQPARWTDGWGGETAIFGLTPELVAASCLPHCKLDVYMEHLRGTSRRYPVAYLRLYQQHPNVEVLLTRGLPLVLDDMIQEKMEGKMDLPKFGIVALEEIDWKETRPAHMLGLTRDELRMARSQGWGLLFWRLFSRTKAAGETLAGADIQAAFLLGKGNVLELIGRGPVGKSIRYLLRQSEQITAEVDDAGADGWVPDVHTLLDYWSMSEQLGRDLTDPSVRYPIDLIRAHDAVTGLILQREQDAMANSFRLRRKQLRKYAFAADGLLIRPAASQRELTEEGDALHHCVSSYGKRHAAGETAIFFIRRASKPGTPYYTLELDERALKVRQNRGSYNRARTPEVQAFEEKWLAWLQSGCQRDKKGRPVLPEKRKGEAA
jgi:hypothetical protein